MFFGRVLPIQIMNAPDFSPFLNIPGMFRIEVLVTKKVDIKMGVHDHSLKMVRNALEEWSGTPWKNGQECLGH